MMHKAMMLTFFKQTTVCQIVYMVDCNIPALQKSNGHFGFCSSGLHTSFLVKGTVMIRTSNQAHERLLRIPESTLCNLARHYKENTVCADVIEFTENRRHPLRALSA